MKSGSKALLYGFFLWLILFILGVVLFPLKKSGDPLFETIMPVAGVVLGVIFTNLYFQKVERDFVQEGIILGLVWFVVNVGIDLLMFMWGPMKMSFPAYMGDVGLTYLMYPAITIGAGFFGRTHHTSLTFPP